MEAMLDVKNSYLSLHWELNFIIVVPSNMVTLSHDVFSLSCDTCMMKETAGINSIKKLHVCFLLV